MPAHLLRLQDALFRRAVALLLSILSFLGAFMFREVADHEHRITASEARIEDDTKASDKAGHAIDQRLDEIRDLQRETRQDVKELLMGSHK